MSDLLDLVQEKFRLPVRKLEGGCLQLEGEVWNLTHSSQFFWEHYFIINIYIFTTSISISNSQR